MMAALNQLQKLVLEHSVDGFKQTAIPNVMPFRSSTTTDRIETFYEPSLCIAIQGAKLAMLGASSYIYNPAEYVVVSVDLPLSGAVIAASVDEPYLGFKMNLDLHVMRSMALDLPRRTEAVMAPAGLTLGKLTPELLDALIRLIGLLSRPDDIPFLGASIEREIIYRLITGPNSALLLQFATADSRLSQVNRAITWIKQHYSEEFRIQTVAETAGMSVSSFHYHFKSVTSMSPLQYQKQIRLHEARRLVMSERMDAAAAGFEVGYDSPSQFSRDYKKVFGAPPMRDIARLRRISATERYVA